MKSPLRRLMWATQPFHWKILFVAVLGLFAGTEIWWWLEHVVGESTPVKDQNSVHHGTRNIVDRDNSLIPFSGRSEDSRRRHMKDGSVLEKVGGNDGNATVEVDSAESTIRQFSDAADPSMHSFKREGVLQNPAEAEEMRRDGKSRGGGVDEPSESSDSFEVVNLGANLTDDDVALARLPAIFEPPKLEASVNEGDGDEPWVVDTSGLGKGGLGASPNDTVVKKPMALKKGQLNTIGWGGRHNSNPGTSWTRRGIEDAYEPSLFRPPLQYSLPSSLDRRRGSVSLEHRNRQRTQQINDLNDATRSPSYAMPNASVSKELVPSTGILVAQLPAAVFPTPSEDLVKLIESPNPASMAEEKERISKVFPFSEPIEVTSIATGKRFSLVFEEVLGCGGQGIVLLARDSSDPRVEFAVKIFRMPKRRQRGPQRDMERLKRRVRWETEILRHVPVDVAPALWSQAAHVVVPLDVIEPVKQFVPPDDDRTRYWHQWVVFDKFVGDLAALRKLPYSSAKARLSATKQMLISVMRMHDMGMVHSDVKTTNFFIHNDGRIFLGDYSMSHPNGEVSPCLEGTIKFLPPENLECHRSKMREMTLTDKKDTWALGIVIYKLWCFGHYPYGLGQIRSEDVVDSMRLVRADQLDFSNCSADAPVAVLHLIRQMLEPDRRIRASLRHLYVAHPVFREKQSVILRDTLDDLVTALRRDGISDIEYEE